MSKVQLNMELEHPAVLVQLTPAGLKISLQAWQHDAPVRMLAGLEVEVQRAIHQWRARFLARDVQFGTPNLRERDLGDEQRSQR